MLLSAGQIAGRAEGFASAAEKASIDGPLSHQIGYDLSISDRLGRARRGILEDGSVMKLHKFKAGQTVTITPNRARATPRGPFKIVRLMPDEQGKNQYRIRSAMDGHERVVLESDLD